MAAEGRALARPPADAEVRVVAFGEDPAVAAAHGAELHHEAAVIAARWKLRVREVSLERNADVLVAAEAECAGAQAVDAVRADERLRRVAPAVRGDGDASLAVLDGDDPRAVAEVGSRLGGTLGEVVVESLALRHVGDRRACAAGDLPAVAQAQVGGRDDVLDDRVERKGQQPRGPLRDAAAARLVAREAGPVEEEDARAGR